MVICHSYWKTIPKNVGKTMVCHQPVIIFIPLLRLSPIKLARKNDSWPPHWDGHSDLFKAIFHEKSTCSWEELWKKWEKLWKKWEDLWKKWEELWKKWENYGKSRKIMEKVGKLWKKWEKLWKRWEKLWLWGDGRAGSGAASSNAAGLESWGTLEKNIREVPGVGR